MTGSVSIPNKIKGLNITPGVQAQQNHSKSFVNGEENISDRLTGGGNLTFSYAYKDKFNITYNNRTSYTHVKNSVTRTAQNNYFIIDNTGSVSFQPIKKWRINTDAIHRSNAGQSFLLINATLQKQFMQNNRLMAELCGFDLLNKNSDVSRYAYDNYISDTRTNNINQYFYLKLIYKVNKIGGAPSRTTTTPVIMEPFY
jgi:hypothetical protein